jgi:hypothetical protein
MIKIKSRKERMKRGIRKYCDKRGQITIFVIVALMIIAGIVIIFFYYKNSSFGISSLEDINSYIERCVGDSLKKAEDEFISGNLYPNMTDNYILYKDSEGKTKKAKYLCKASQFYNPCINQEPMLAEYVRREIEKKTSNDAEKCFNEINVILRKKGYSITEENLDFKIEFTKKTIIANMNKKLIVKKGEETRIFENFRAEIQSPLYSLIDTARNIINFESTLCEFNMINWMKYNSDVSIKKFVASDQTKIYAVEDKTSRKSISFAVKTCVLPAGI